MNEYFTAPTAPASGARARSALIKEIIDAVDAAFDNIPAGLAATLEDLNDKWVDEIGLPALESGKYLSNDGTSLEWEAPLPTQTGNSGKILTTDGTDASWTLHYPDQSGKSGYTLKSDGTNAGWELVPQTGYFQATASGGCTAGNLATIGSDGTVSEVTEGSGASQDEVMFEVGATKHIASCVDTANDVIVFAYQDDDDSDKGKAVVGTVSGGEITFGLTAEFEAGATYEIDCCYDAANGKVVIVYTDGGDSSYGKAIVGTVSGTSISFGTAVTFSSASTSSNNCGYDSTNEKVVVFYTAGGNASGVVGTVSGDSISFGSAATLKSGGTGMTSCYDSEYGVFVVAYQDGYSQTYASIGTVSGTSISFQGEESFDSTTYDAIDCVYDPVNKKAVVFLNSVTNLAARVIDVVSGSGLTLGDQTFLYGVNGSSHSACYDDVNEKILLFVRRWTTGYYVWGMPLTVSGLEITAGNASAISSDSGSYLSCSFLSNTAVVGFSLGTSGTGNAVVYDLTNTANQWVGIFSETVADGETVTVTIVGGIDTNQTGLTPGQRYYVNSDGSLVTTATNFGEIGVAITATSLLITKGGAE